MPNRIAVVHPILFSLNVSTLLYVAFIGLQCTVTQYNVDTLAATHYPQQARLPPLHHPALRIPTPAAQRRSPAALARPGVI